MLVKSHVQEAHRFGHDLPPAKLKDKAEKLEARKAELTELLDNADEPPPLLHLNMARMYQDRIGSVAQIV